MPRPKRPARWRYGLAVGLSLWLGACAAPPVVSPPETAPAQPVGAQDWSGRFSVRRAHFAAERQDAATGRFALRRQQSLQGPALALELSSPLGQTMARAWREPDGTASLQLADGRQFQAQGLDALLQQTLGWTLPVERLPQWLEDQFELVIARDAQGQIAQARDSGWHIERTPGRWALQRPTDDGHIRIVLVLDR